MPKLTTTEKPDIDLAQHIMVAADADPSKFQSTKHYIKWVLDLADDLAGTGIILKLNTAIRAAGYGIIQEIKDRNLHVFADLKLNDIPNTMRNDSIALSKEAPEFLTVMASSEVDGMKIINAGASVLAVTVLTSMNEEQCQAVYGCSVKAAVLKLARLAKLAGCAGVVCSPAELDLLNSRPELRDLMFVTPGIRPMWAGVIEGDDQDKKRVMTPAHAIDAGADYLVIGRPIVGQEDAEAKRYAIERTLGEMQSVLKSKRSREN
jgi:orotidine-5'-phosphate decarboxylase